MPKVQQSSVGNIPLTSYQAATAGTVQTQAGATVITAANVKVTNGNANDGVALPDASNAANIGQEVTIQNSHATNALKVYGAVGNGATIDAGSADAAVSQAGASTFKYVQTAAKVWKSLQTS